MTPLYQFCTPTMMMSALLYATLALAALLAIVAAIDIRTMRIPDALNAVIAATGLLAAWLLQHSLLASIIGIIAGYASMAAITQFYRIYRGRDGLGLGDAKLLAGAGAWLGWAGLPFVVLLASALGLAFVAGRAVFGVNVKATDAIAFGPFLCAGVFVVWVVQNFYV